MTETLTVMENSGYGVYRTDAGNYLVDYALNGVDQVLQNSDSGAVEYLIVRMERDHTGQIHKFEVKKFAQEAPEAPGYEAQ